jgi:hypothetical protein
MLERGAARLNGAPPPPPPETGVRCAEPEGACGLGRRRCRAGPCALMAALMAALARRRVAGVNHRILVWIRIPRSARLY